MARMADESQSDKVDKRSVIGSKNGTVVYCKGCGNAIYIKVTQDEK